MGIIFSKSVFARNGNLDILVSAHDGFMEYCKDWKVN